MRTLSFLLTAAALCAGAVAAEAAPAPGEIIAKARSRVAPEKALGAITTLTFEGSITVFNDNLPQKSNTGYIQIDYKAPGSRREYRLDPANRVESVTASNGLEGFTQVTQLSNGRKQLASLPVAAKRSYEDLYAIDTGFFATPPKGTVRGAGEELNKTLNKPAWVLEYAYRNGTRVKRYFDKQTGAFLAQELSQKDPSGAETPADKRALQVDEGELKVKARFPKPAAAGAAANAKPEFDEVEFTFPKTTTTYVGGKKVSVLEYTAVRVNGLVLDSAFQYPMP